MPLRRTSSVLSFVELGGLRGAKGEVAAVGGGSEIAVRVLAAGLDAGAKYFRATGIDVEVAFNEQRAVG